MELADYISTDQITISPKQTIREVLPLFTNETLTHLPVVDNNIFYGNVSKEDLMNEVQIDKKIAEFGYLYEVFFTQETDTLLDIFSLFALNNTNIIPVLNQEKEYAGFIEMLDAFEAFANTHFIKTDGNILVLEKNTSDYKTSEVSQIIESNDNTLLGLFTTHKSPEKVQVLIKIEPKNTNEIIQSFRRYEYTIINKLEEDSYLEGLKNRSEYFIKYLNI